MKKSKYYHENYSEHKSSDHIGWHYAEDGYSNNSTGCGLEDGIGYDTEGLLKIFNFLFFKIKNLTIFVKITKLGYF
jgi:hypothetical protein